MSVRYLIERNYDFSPVLLSNGSKIAINIKETGNSCKVIYEPSVPKNGNRYSFEVIDRTCPKYIKIAKENSIQMSLLTPHEENQVLKRRHYFDNTVVKTVGPLMRYTDKKYSPSACWELRSKTHSVQELSEKFEIYKDNSSQSLYKSSSRLMERKLTFLISGRLQKMRNYLPNSYRKKCQYVEYPYRSQPIGVNLSDNSLNTKTTQSKSQSFWDYKTIDHVPQKRLNESISKFSSTICIPVINHRLCYSSINLSGPEYKIVNNRHFSKRNDEKTFGSTKSMESLFINSQQNEVVEIPIEKKEKEKKKSEVEDVRELYDFHENIKTIKSLLKPVDNNKALRYKNIHRLKKKSNNQLEKKIKFFENWTDSSKEKEDFNRFSLSETSGPKIDIGLSNISLSEA